MKLPSHKTGSYVIKLFLVCLCVVIGASFGIEIRRDVGPVEVTLFELEDVNLPADIREKIPPGYAAGSATAISIHLARSLLGALAGGIVGLLIALISMKKSRGHDERESRRNMSSFRNISYMLGCLLLFAIIWTFSVYMIVRTVPPSTHIGFRLITRSMAIVAAVVSWISVGRKIRLGENIPRIVNWLLLGLFNYARFSRLNPGQHKLLWVCSMLIMFIVFFPPWVAFGTAMGGKGIGDPVFVGFHFVLCDQYAVLGTAPYAIAEITHKTQLILIAIVLLCTLLGVLYLTKKPDQETDAASERNCVDST